MFGTRECPNGLFPFSSDDFLQLIADRITALIDIIDVFGRNNLNIIFKRDWLKNIIEARLFLY